MSIARVTSVISCDMTVRFSKRDRWVILADRGNWSTYLWLWLCQCIPAKRQIRIKLVFGVRVARYMDNHFQYLP